jgi:hypothetical protein
MALTNAQKNEMAVKSAFAEKIFKEIKEDSEINQIDSSAYAIKVMVDGKERFIKVSLVLAKEGYDVDDAIAEYVDKISERDAKEKDAEVKKAKKIADAEKKKAEKASK